MEPGKKLKAHRKSRGLTAQDAATDLGCVRSTVTLIETGRRSPSLALASAIERFTGGFIRAAEWAARESVVRAAPAGLPRRARARRARAALAAP